MATRMKMEDAIEDVLKRHGPLSCKAIARHIQKEGLARLGGKTPVNTIRACVVRSSKVVRVGTGMYALKTKPLLPDDGKGQNRDGATSIKYQYVEQLIKMSSGHYYHININDIITAIVAEKSRIVKALKIEFPEFTNDKLPCVYVLSVNAAQRKIYVGETYEALVRIGRWNNIKDYAHVAVIYAKRLTSANIRKNIERVVMETFEEAGRQTENKTKIKVDLGHEEKHPYEQIKENVPIVVNKITAIFEAPTSADMFAKGQKESPDVLDEKQRRARETWSAAYHSAGRAARETVTKAVQSIKSSTDCLTFEGAWLYFADGKATRKQSFAALRIIGKEKLDLVFLAPETDVLPKNTRRVKPFVLSHGSECRLRLDQINLKDTGEIATRARDYLRLLNKTSK